MQAQQVSRRAVEAVLDEIDRIGEPEFLRRYRESARLGESTRYTYRVRRGNRDYPAKAVWVVAHLQQYGQLLSDGRRRGGSDGANRVLEGLGYEVFPRPRWHISVGEVVTRAEVAKHYGGATMGGIQPSSTTPNILVYSDPVAGRQHGYDFDGWSADEPGVFYYTGEGRSGDQTLTRGNLSLLRHQDGGKKIRLFEAAGKSRAGGVPQRYLGCFRLDPENSFRREEARDDDGSIRSVIVFRFLVDEEKRESPPATGVRAPDPRSTPLVDYIPCETNLAVEYEVTAHEAQTAQRREAQLMKELEEALASQGHDVRRIAIVPPGQTSKLYTDTFDLTTGTLYEAKAAATRANVRTAIGQLLDYRRHVEDVRELAVLLPADPGRDLVDLIHSCGMTLVTPAGATFPHHRPER